MTNMIDELRTDHLDLSISFDGLGDIDVTSEAGKDSLRRVKAVFLAHMKRENDELYPALRDASFNNGKLQQTLDWFTKDFVRIFAVTILFLDKYAEGGTQREFEKAHNRLNKILNALLRQEENIIFTEYLKIHPYSEAA
jgi:hypothetical protein